MLPFLIISCFWLLLLEEIVGRLIKFHFNKLARYSENKKAKVKVKWNLNSQVKFAFLSLLHTVEITLATT